MLPNPFLVHPSTHLSEQGVLEWEAEEECTNMEGAAHCTGEEREEGSAASQAKAPTAPPPSKLGLSDANDQETTTR